MAIAGISLYTVPEALTASRDSLKALPETVEVREADANTLAAVLEAPLERLEALISRMENWEGVVDVGLAYVNYEDELDAEGRVICPPNQLERLRSRQGKKFRGARAEG